MSAGLLQNDSMAYSERGGLPWHQLGNPIDDANLANVGEVRRLAGLGWRVVEYTPHITLADGTEVPLNTPKIGEFGETLGNTGYRALVRDDDNTVLSVVQGRYNVVQNDVVFDIADSISTVDQSVSFETAGSLRGGRTVWALAKMGSDPRLDGLGLEDYLLVVTTHDGSSPILIVPTKVRVVCCNTLAMAKGRRGSAASFKIRHTVSADERIESAKLALAKMADTTSAVDDDIVKLLDTVVDDATFDSIIKGVFGDPDEREGKGKTQTQNRLNVVRSSYHLDDNAEIFGTGFGVVNAVNDAEIWGSSIRGQQSREEQQLRRVIDNAQPLTQKARDLILA